MIERDIDALNHELKNYLSLFKELKENSLLMLTSNVKSLDQKVGVDTTSFRFDRYGITNDQIKFSTKGLPKIISERLSSGNVSVQLERDQGRLELRLVDSASKNIVGVELSINQLNETRVNDSGIFILTPDGEIEIDPNMRESHGMIDQVFNHSEYIRAIAAQVVFSKVIEGLLSENSVIEQKSSKPFKPAWE